MKAPLSLLFVFVGGAAVGWLAGPRHSAGPSEAHGSGSSPGGKSSGRTQGLNRSAGTPEEVRRLLAPVREARSAAERMQATVDLARNMPLSELKDWYAKGWFGMHGSIEAEVFARITRDRWISARPQEAMAFLMTRDPQGATAGMREWARLDSAAALDFVVGCKDRKQSNNLLWAAVQGIGPDTDPGLIMASLPKLTGGPFYTPTLQPLIILVAGKLPPEQLAAQSATWPAELRRAVQGALDGAAFSRDPSAFMTSLASVNGGESKLRLFAALDSTPANAEAILSRVDEWPQAWLKDVLSQRPAWLVNRDPQRWLREDLSALGLDGKLAWQVRASALGKLAPEAALAAIKEIPEGTPEERRLFVAAALQKLALTDFSKAESLLASLSDPLELEAARRKLDAVAQSQAAAKNPLPQTLDQRIEQLFSGEFDAGSGRESMENWSLAEGAAAVDRFRQLSAERQSEFAKQMEKRGFQGLQPAFQGEVISWLVANSPPLPETREFPPPTVVKTISSVASRWTDEDPVAAGHWALSLPAGPDRNQALGTVASTWEKSEPSAARTWIATLPAEDRSGVEAALGKNR